MGKVIKTHIDLRTFQGKIKKIGLESIPTLPNEKHAEVGLLGARHRHRVVRRRDGCEFKKEAWSED